MAETIFGKEPHDFTVKMTVGADFYQPLRNTIREPDGSLTDTDWPVGTVLTLEFSNEGSAAFQTFTADITGPLAEWAEDKAVVATMPPSCDVKVAYANGTDDDVLFMGRAQRRG